MVLCMGGSGSRPSGFRTQLVSVTFYLGDLGKVYFIKAMTNLESILKSRDITLLTKVHTVKAIVFPVMVMYGCESWTMKKTEHRSTDAFKL